MTNDQTCPLGILNSVLVPLINTLIVNELSGWLESKLEFGWFKLIRTIKAAVSQKNQNANHSQIENQTAMLDNAGKIMLATFLFKSKKSSVI